MAMNSQMRAVRRGMVLLGFTSRFSSRWSQDGWNDSIKDANAHWHAFTRPRRISAHLHNTAELHNPVNKPRASLRGAVLTLERHCESRSPAECPVSASLLEGAVQGAADAGEGSADVAGKGVHSGCRRQGDQGYDERILNQVLAFVLGQAALQILHADVQVQRQVLHFLPSWVV